MKLVDVTTNTPLVLPKDLVWTDEHSWTPVAAEVTHSLTGALIVETMLKQAGRPITLKGADDSMGWISRADLSVLFSWLTPTTRALRLELEYANDTRTFNVAFRHPDTPIEASPVAGFTEHDSAEWCHLTLRLMEV